MWQQKEIPSGIVTDMQPPACFSARRRRSQAAQQHSWEWQWIESEDTTQLSAPAPWWARRREEAAPHTCLSASSGSVWLAVITGSVQFLAAITTDNATLPMATAVAPNSHFQLRACGQTRLNECRADVEWLLVSFYFFFIMKQLKSTVHPTAGLEESCDERTTQTRTEGLTHPWRLGPVFQVDTAACGVPQHLFVHGLLCPSLLRVFLHQLGKLRVDGLHQGDKIHSKQNQHCCSMQIQSQRWRAQRKVICSSYGWAFQRGSRQACHSNNDNNNTFYFMILKDTLKFKTRVKTGREIMWYKLRLCKNKQTNMHYNKHLFDFYYTWQYSKTNMQLLFRHHLRL